MLRVYNRCFKYKQLEKDFFMYRLSSVFQSLTAIFFISNYDFFD
jgi:hypothetical protein